MKIAFSYVRFSTPQQILGDSLRRQVEAAELFCKENGYVLDKTLTLHDKGVSAFKGANIEIGRLGEFLRLVKSGKVKKGSALCVENLDRLSRGEITDALGIFLDLIRDGITVITLTDKMIYNRESVNRNPGELMASIVFLMRAHDESKLKSIRVKAAYDQRKKLAKESGKPMLGWNPPWCDFDGVKGYVLNPDRVKIVRRIFDEYLQGNGPFRISRILNKEKLNTLGHRGSGRYKNTSATWYKKTIRDFLNDKRVYGFCEFLERENYYPTIISKDRFNAVQQRRALRQAAPRTGGAVENVGNLFTGLLRCAHCDSVMAKTSTNKTYNGKTTHYEYLVCDGARQGKECSYKSIPYGQFEYEILATIRSDEFFLAMTETNPDKQLEERVDSLKGERVINEKQIEKLMKKILEQESPPKMLVTTMKQLELRQDEIGKEIRLTLAKFSSSNSFEHDFKDLASQTDSILKTPSGRLKVREFLRSCVEQIYVNTKKNESIFRFKTGFEMTKGMWEGEEIEAPDGFTTIIKLEKYVKRKIKF